MLTASDPLQAFPRWRARNVNDIEFKYRRPGAFANAGKKVRLRPPCRSGNWARKLRPASSGGSVLPISILAMVHGWARRASSRGRPLPPHVAAGTFLVNLDDF